MQCEIKKKLSTHLVKKENFYYCAVSVISLLGV